MSGRRVAGEVGDPDRGGIARGRQEERRAAGRLVLVEVGVREGEAPLGGRTVAGDLDQDDLALADRQAERLGDPGRGPARRACVQDRLAVGAEDLEDQVPRGRRPG